MMDRAELKRRMQIIQQGVDNIGKGDSAVWLRNYADSITAFEAEIADERAAAKEVTNDREEAGDVVRYHPELDDPE